MSQDDKFIAESDSGLRLRLQAMNENSDNPTMWGWVNGGFEFYDKEGDSLDAEQLAHWQQGCKEHGDTMSWREAWVEVNGTPQQRTIYRVEGGGLAEILRNAADKQGEPDHAPPSMSGWMTNSSAFMRSDLFPGRGAEDLATDMYSGTPEWEGSPGLIHAFEACEWIQAEYHREQVINGVDTVTADARGYLKTAHPVVIPPEQVHVLPEMETMEAVEYAQKLEHLPFNPLFLDTSGEAGTMHTTSMLSHGYDTQLVALIGGIMRRNPEDSSFQCIPFGAGIIPVKAEGERITREAGVEVAKWKDGRSGFLLSDGYGNGLSSHAPIGTLMVSDHITPERGEIVMLSGIGTDSEITDETDTRLTDFWTPLEDWHKIDREKRPLEIVSVNLSALPGKQPTNAAVLLACPRPFGWIDNYTVAEGRNRILGWTAIVVRQFGKLMSILQLLDSHNVEIVEQKVSRQVRRNAERHDTPIAKTVSIRHRRSASRERNPDAEPMQFSHSFEVIGHTRHVTRGVHVWCKGCKGEGVVLGQHLPDGSQEEKECEVCHGFGLNRAVLTPCARRDDKTGELTCPNGCRKEWAEPFVKGEGPLILKTRKQAGGPVGEPGDRADPATG